MRTKEKMIQWGIIMITKSKKFYVSFLMAFMMFLSCLMPAIGVLSSEKTAFADDSPKTKVYYITDYAGSDEIEQEIISQTSLTSNPLTVERLYFSREDGFLNLLMQYYNNTLLGCESWENIRNAYILFEIRTPILKQVVPEDADEPVLTEILYNMFAKMKENNCKIMFINGTDETLFGEYTDFLDKVDIHVNINILHLFIASIFQRIIDTCNTEKWHDVTFIFSQNLSFDIKSGFKRCWFFNDYFIAYIRSVYREEIEWGALSRDVFENNNIKIVCHAPKDETTNEDVPNRFYDVVRCTYFNWQEEPDKIANEHIYALGTTWDDEDSDVPYSLGWLRLMLEMRSDSMLEDDFNIFIYNDAQYTFSEFFAEGVYKAHSVSDVNYVILPFVMGDSNMVRFDNWDGRCIITHKPVQRGAGGWLLERIDLNVPGWLDFMTQEDYDYFFNYSDDWDTAWQGGMIG